MGKYCCVVGCKSDWMPYSNISFHKFPKNSELCSKWLDVLSVQSVSEHKLVCSLHFKNEDFMEHTSIRRLKAHSIPSYNLDIPEEYDSDNLSLISETEWMDGNDGPYALPSPASNDSYNASSVYETKFNIADQLSTPPSPATNNFDISPQSSKGSSPMLSVSTKYMMCRVCLAAESDRKLYHMSEQNILALYEQLTGVQVGGSRLHHVCWECAHRLRTYAQFRSKALQANTLLETLPNENSYILISKQLKAHLSSNLKRIQTNTHPDFEYTYPAVKKEEYISDSGDEQPVYLDEEYIDETMLKDEQEIKNETESFETFASLDNTKIESHDETLATLKGTEDSKNMLSSLHDITGNHNNYRKPTNYGDVVSRQNTKNIKSSARVLRRDTRNLNGTKLIRNNGSLVKSSDGIFNTTKSVLNEDIIETTELSHEEQVANMVKKKYGCRFKESNYKCMECFMGYMDRDIYDWHMSRHDIKNGPYKCDVCKLRFRTHSKLKYHVTSEHAMKFSCKRCPFVTSARYSAKLHEAYHNGATFQCPYCTMTFGKISTYLGHVRIKHPSDCVCELCGFMFLGARGLAAHKKLKHRFQQEPLEGPYCEVCDVQFASEEAHDRHLELSSKHRSDQEPSRIPNCSQGVINRKCRKRSSQNVGMSNKKRRAYNAPITVACEQCGAELAGMRAYSQHFMRAHPGLRRSDHPLLRVGNNRGVMCELCGRIFRSECFLKQHMWAHRGAEKPFACGACARGFLHAHSAALHAALAHPGARAPPAHACPDCGKLFSRLNNMQKHRFIHTGLKPFKCETCGKCFRTVHQQRAHFDHVHLKKPWPERPDRRRGKPRPKTED